MAWVKDSSDGYPALKWVPDHELEEYKGDKDVPSGHGTYHNPAPTSAPPVPKNSGGGSHETTVSTPSMEVFASNIERLIAPCQKAHQALKGVDVHPGAFFHANLMRSKISGGGGEAGGIKDAYTKILDDLADGLTDLCNGVRLMSKKYASTEEANEMTAKELDEYVHRAGSDFQALGQHSSTVG
ncbi:hypothetical protein [Streptomyces dysideae]|uniref:Uncharacterized protein n=1 Tax=Streptomyces dysideae TaxID=909626 RepID=A0A101UVB0_9ACTN|nr:hypothetical protein [Streptomyces dysideae]KUO17517.1 hypothetical protein AQJ91_29400 [Streptomyces dysideae]